MDGQGTKRCRNVAENFNRLSSVHERYRQTDRQTIDRRQTTDGRATAYIERSLKIISIFFNNAEQVIFMLTK